VAPKSGRATRLAAREEHELVAVDSVHEAAIEAACDLDRAWFERHPEASSYVRPALEHELCLPGGPCVSYDRMWVWQAAPGVRARFPM
jgi:hypothetical protein